MNKLRFRSGQVHLRKVPVDANTVIEAGDLVWLDGAIAKPASDLDWQTDLATTQSEFAARFLGVAHQPSKAGETAPISVDVSPDAVYEFDCNPTLYSLGQSLGVDANGSQLMNKQLEIANPVNSVARAAEFTDGPVSTLRVTFASAFYTGSSNASAALG
ncbi:MAG: DUF2190 family protein [Planctomycetaceae bacterium]|nr:DUF2190 family protein [Planctomycetaceae bacterium]